NSLQALGPIISLLGEGYDVVCGSRYVPGGGYHGFPLGRRIWSVGANLVMRWYCGLVPVKDYTLFYRGYRAELLQEAFRRYGRRTPAWDAVRGRQPLTRAALRMSLTYTFWSPGRQSS